eukprot:CAMPEP_0183711718 /NCGR_PEP_ID=MMETSP0737-20130205/7149_1 /TAXON_ID=385413 /ORGANISM="Thalassiosira miniscula, Strain CCMP1093" /LENGTH=404 /DNA_ID=CAMNT_0025940285 /DNA_START=12 /DNA_END=1226 /DNA_ORIENTATION=-
MGLLKSKKIFQSSRQQKKKSTATNGGSSLPAAPTHSNNNDKQFKKKKMRFLRSKKKKQAQSQSHVPADKLTEPSQSAAEIYFTHISASASPTRQSLRSNHNESSANTQQQNQQRDHKVKKSNETNKILTPANVYEGNNNESNNNNVDAVEDDTLLLPFQTTILDADIEAEREGLELTLTEVAPRQPPSTERSPPKLPPNVNSNNSEGEAASQTPLFERTLTKLQTMACKIQNLEFAEDDELQVLNTKLSDLSEKLSSLKNRVEEEDDEEDDEGKQRAGTPVTVTTNGSSSNGSSFGYSSFGTVTVTTPCSSNGSSSNGSSYGYSSFGDGDDSISGSSNSELNDSISSADSSDDDYTDDEQQQEEETKDERLMNGEGFYNAIKVVRKYSKSGFTFQNQTTNLMFG